MDNSTGNMRFVYVDILKIIGICLILNSHLDSIYPIAQLATGGALGNALFFICAGFCFQSKGKNFVRWYLKKVVALYVPVYIVTTITIVFHPLNSVREVIVSYIWPTEFWFIGAIMLFYILLYIAEKYDFIKRMRLCFIALTLLYAIYYVFLLDTSSYVIESAGLMSINGAFKLIYYFGIMFLGKYMRQYKIEKIKGRKRYLTAAIVSVALLYLIKAIEQNSVLLMHFQFAEHLFVTIFAVSLLTYCINSKWLNNIKSENITAIVQKFSSISLDIYLVQFAVIAFCSSHFQFPINWIVSVAMSFICAFLLHTVSIWIIKGIKKLERVYV